MKSAIREMHRQVGDLVLDEEGIAVQGLLVRHLVLPAGLAGTAEVVRFLSQEISPNTYLNIMSQYRPEYNACRFPELSRPITVPGVQRSPAPGRASRSDPRTGNPLMPGGRIINK